MKITVKAYSLPERSDRFPSDGILSVPDGSTVGEVVDLLRLPPELDQILLRFVNGRLKEKDHVLKPGDQLVFFPRLEGG